MNSVLLKKGAYGIVALLMVAAWLIPAKFLQAQEIPAYNPVLSEMGELESQRDAKCHATASRLEDFIYGTPLSAEARQARINFQQTLVSSIWSQYTQWWQQNEQTASLEAFQQVVALHFRYRQHDQGIQVQLPAGEQVFISARDVRQYSSIAYAYRAILAVQQSCTLASLELAPLEGPILEYFKQSIDIAVLGVLHQADERARSANSQRIERQHMVDAIVQWPFKFAELNQRGELIKIPAASFVYPIIREKLSAYQAYNEINQAVFLRNIQVYFTKVPWPNEAEISNALKNHFNEINIAFTREVLILAQQMAAEQGNVGIQYAQMYQAVQDYLPHSVNLFEDVLYFPRLPDGATSIQAYDLDAFRDSGLHWQYLKFALDDIQNQLQLAPDPFALEMLVEGSAQFAVFIFRIAGTKAKELGAERLNIEHLNLALADFQARLQQYEGLPTISEEPRTIASAPDRQLSQSGLLFEDQSAPLGVKFEHRNSDWLSRLIRGYIVKDDENLARLSIPPAFGGGGVAAEDINGDGWTDILLLGGQGCTLYENQAGRQFMDRSTEAGINWQRPDGTYPEARQPLIADFDNDGDQDIIIIYANDQHRVLENTGNWTFRDQTQTAELGGKELIGGPSTVIDFDGDGLLDLYIGYFGNYLKGNLPTLRRHNTNGTPNKLFRNLGNFRFAEVTEDSGVDNPGWTQAVGHTDINGDGWQDLIAGNDFGTNSYYLNNQDGTFTDISEQAGTSKPSYTMNVGVGDINGDLRPDFYISNIVVMEKDDKYVLPNEDTQAHFDPKSLASMRVVEANDLFVSASAQETPLPAYQQSQNIGRGYRSTGWSWDADFFDFDNDSDLDLYCLTGMNQYSIYSAENPYFTDSNGTPLDITLAQSLAEKNVLFSNSEGQLSIVENTSGLDYEGTSRSAAYLDFDHDGDLDVIINEFQGPARFFVNQSEDNGNNWISVKLQGTGKRSNPDAIGAQVIVELPDGRKLWREVHSTDGYLSVHPKTLHFGLGQHQKVNLEIIWPDGSRERHIDLIGNQLHRFTQN
ncbi:MAG: CRTAC1 family protein [Bacteroidota bacterium]